jgi:hypothetical protein
MPLFDMEGLEASGCRPGNATVSTPQPIPARSKAPLILHFLDGEIGMGICNIVNRLRGSQVIGCTGLDVRSGCL